MRVGVLCLVLAAVPLTAASRYAVSSNSVRVTVTEEVAPAGVLYRYTVTNSLQSDPIAQFWVGYDYFDGLFELKRPPKGWTPDGGLRAESARSPRGWSVEVMTQEEAEEVRLDWSAPEPRFQLQPGRSVTFSIFVEKREPTYTKGHWTAGIHY